MTSCGFSLVVAWHGTGTVQITAVGGGHVALVGEQGSGVLGDRRNRIQAH